MSGADDDEEEPRVGSLDAAPGGALVEREGEAWYEIDSAELMRPFLMSIVSDNDHWLFVASNGGLTAGRRNSDRALFPTRTSHLYRDGRMQKSSPG
jgi:hypothetical protein